MLGIGQVLQNRYTIQAVLGQGGMGAVYKASDNRTHVLCVVKEMQVQTVTPQEEADAEAQFRQEAITLAHLQHPNLPRVTDYFSELGSYFLVMDVVEGRSLDKLIGTNGLPETQLVSYATQLLDALVYCHSRDVIHRDIKPENIIIRPDGTAMLVDFGLVKVMTNLANATKTFIRGMGTPNYAPPEQYGSGGTDERSDIYALGATLYQAATGQLPPSATDRSAGMKVIELRRFNATFSPQVEQAISRAMMLDRGRRFQSAAEFKIGLTQFAPQHGRHGTANILRSISFVAICILAILAIGWLAGRGLNTAGGDVPTPKVLPTLSSTFTPRPQPTAIPTQASVQTAIPVATLAPTAFESSTPVPAIADTPVPVEQPTTIVLPTAAPIQPTAPPAPSAALTCDGTQWFFVKHPPDALRNFRITPVVVQDFANGRLVWIQELSQTWVLFSNGTWTNQGGDIDAVYQPFASALGSATSAKNSYDAFMGDTLVGDTVTAYVTDPGHRIMRWSIASGSMTPINWSMVTGVKFIDCR